MYADVITFLKVLDPITRKKIHVFGSGKKEEAKAIKFLHEMIDPKNLPPHLGGTSCLFGESPMDVQMAKDMNRVLKARGVESITWAKDDENE